ncbi:hypothetical protein [Streptomyces sp. NPDC088775]|uniref:zinc finger domain-containing protein n=1 Tax=Streptomyces sp. NPDC088775 TaxID=3365896 RepID=UPI003805CF28
MTHREPTIHHPALMVTCPRCESVPGAHCFTPSGSRLPDGRVHRDRADAHRNRQAA